MSGGPFGNAFGDQFGVDSLGLNGLFGYSSGLYSAQQSSLAQSIAQNQLHHAQLALANYAGLKNAAARPIAEPTLPELDTDPEPFEEPLSGRLIHDAIGYGIGLVFFALALVTWLAGIH